MNETQELILEKIGELSREFPELRIGQLIDIFVTVPLASKGENCFFNLTDKEFLKILEEQIEKHSLKKYDVTVTETLQKTLTVKARSKEEAIEQVKTAYLQENIVLDSSDFLENDFKAKLIIDK